MSGESLPPPVPSELPGASGDSGDVVKVRTTETGVRIVHKVFAITSIPPANRLGDTSRALRVRRVGKEDTGTHEEMQRGPTNDGPDGSGSYDVRDAWPAGDNALGTERPGEAIGGK